MIQLQSLTKSFGERVLLDDVTWQISAGERVGLCGPNGAGKTTLLRMLAGLEEPDGGTITRPATLAVGYLPQDGLMHTGRPLAEEVSLAFGPLLEARAEIERIEHALADPALPDGEHEKLLVRYHDLTDSFRQHEGHSIELRVTQVLEGLGFSEIRLRQADGDVLRRLADAHRARQAAARRPTLLLLDEPTNHLDLDARNWLEDYLCAYPHPIILVSHDRFFLDAVVTKIADLSLRTITDYVGTLLALSRRARNATRAAAQGQARAGRRDRADAGLHRPVPLSGDEGRSGAEPDQDARQASCPSRCRPNGSASTSRSRPAPRAAGWSWSSRASARRTARTSSSTP